MTGPDHADRCLQTRTTASEGPSCARCGGPLRGRRRTFCSDGCRMQARRAEQSDHEARHVTRRQALLETIREAVAALEEELIP